MIVPLYGSGKYALMEFRIFIYFDKSAVNRQKEVTNKPSVRWPTGLCDHPKAAVTARRVTTSPFDFIFSIQNCLGEVNRRAATAALGRSLAGWSQSQWFVGYVFFSVNGRNFQAFKTSWNFGVSDAPSRTRQSLRPDNNLNIPICNVSFIFKW